VSSESNPHALAAGTRIRDYTIQSVIGTGGFSIVYKALDNSLMREVAIKEYFPGAFATRDHDGNIKPHSRDSEMFSKGIESFLNEGKLLAQFDHPALVRVYRCWEERGSAYLAMRLYSGVTLRDAVIAGSWRADEVSLRGLLQPMCDALELLHASQCYHRDVAPDNIMLVESGAPVLLDFGAARRTIESTQVFTAILKPGYAPIEQYGDGELKQGPWTDIYALAGVVHFTLSGRAPPTAISRILKDGMVRPQEAFAGQLPPHWLEALERSLAVKPENRPQSIAEFREQFAWDEADVVTEPAILPVPPERVSSAAASQLADDRTVVVTSTKPRTVTVPVPAPQTARPAFDEVDDERTVVVPRRTAEAQVAAAENLLPPTSKSALAQVVPAASATPTTLPATPAPVAAAPAPQPSPVANAAATPPQKSRNLLWVGVAAGLIAIAGLAWKLTSSPLPATSPSPAPAPNATFDKAPGLPSKTGDDTSAGKKSSVPVELSSAPKQTIAPQANPNPAQSTDRPGSVNPSSTKSASNAQPREDRKRETPAKKARAAASEGDDAEERSTTSARKRPARCDLLIERFQLGEALSEADNRFIRESCK
jgi:serine/threonine protein kinase